MSLFKASYTRLNTCEVGTQGRQELTRGGAEFQREELKEELACPTVGPGLADPQPES